MNSFSNFSTFNGCVLPGSGTWVARDADDFYVDENGCLWAPCLCGEEDKASGLGPVTGPALARCPGGPYARDALSGPRSVIRYSPDNSGDFVLVNYPEAVLYYPMRRLPAGHNMGMLADADKGARWFYKGTHKGRVRLHISQRNATRHMAIRVSESPACVGLSPEELYRGVPFRYAILLENTRDTPASAVIGKQGASIGIQAGAAQAKYFRSSAEPPIEIPPHSRVWLYLGADKFLLDESGQMLIEPGCWIEAQMDLEFSAQVTMVCCAYADKARVDPALASFWPLPPASLPESARPQGLLAAHTGVSSAWQIDGRFTWTLDDDTFGRPVILGAAPAYDEGKGYRGWVTNLSRAAERENPGIIDRETYFAVREDAVPLRVPVAVPAKYSQFCGIGGGPGMSDGLERMLFEPPPGPITVEGRDCEAASRGVVYHQVFVVNNRGKHDRRVQYYVTHAGGPGTSASMYHVNENRVIHLVSSEIDCVPDVLVAHVLVPAGETREIEIYFIHGTLCLAGPLGHRLTANDNPA